MTVEGWKITSDMMRSRDRPVRAESDYSPRFLDTYDCPLHMIAECPHNMLVRLTPNNPRSALTATDHSFLVSISLLESQVMSIQTESLRSRWWRSLLVGHGGGVLWRLVAYWMSISHLKGYKVRKLKFPSWTTTKTSLNNSRIQTCAESGFYSVIVIILGYQNLKLTKIWKWRAYLWGIFFLIWSRNV